MPPSIIELENRLRQRKTETEEKIQQRVAKATVELEDSKHFDLVLNNDILEHAIDEAESIILKFIAK